MHKIKKIISLVNGQKVGIDFSEINSEVKSEITNVTNQLSKLKYSIKYGSKSFRSALIFYSYPTDLNGLYEVDLVVPVIGQYDLAVFGGELCEPDCEAHQDTIKIISQLNESYGTEVFGYVPIGCLTPEEDPEIDVSNLTIDEIKTRILSWKEMGAKGVFLDEFGYDYRTTRERQNEIVDFCHENSLHIIVNAWEVDHVFGTDNYIVEAGNTKKHPGNPNNLECHLTEDDYMFFEHLMFYAPTNKKVTAEAPWNVYRVQEYYEKYYKQFKTQVFIANQVPTKASEAVQKELIRCSQIAGAVMQADVVSVAGEFWSSESSKTFYVEPFEIDGVKSRFIDVTYKGGEDTGYPIKFKSVIGSKEFELIWNAKNEDDEVYSSTKNYSQVNSNRNYPLNVSAEKLIYQDYEITAKHNFKNGINLNGVTLNGNTNGSLTCNNQNIVRSVNGIHADVLGNVTVEGGAIGGAGLKIGDIGLAPLGIDETDNCRRYLNGQVILQSQFVAFTAKLKGAIVLYPNLATTEENWQSVATLSPLGQCGKFVIDDEAGTIRLPKVVNVMGALDLSTIGQTVEAGLPNIEGSAQWQYMGYTTETNLNGAFGVNKNATPMVGETSAGNANNSGYPITFDASKSNSIYGNSETVQQEAIKYPYFIQVATSNNEDVQIDTQVRLNNPFSLFMPYWSPIELNNLSWLRSNKQWNNGSVYVSAYEFLLEKYNAGTEQTETISDVSVTYILADNGMKIITDKSKYDELISASGSAFFFVLDTENTQFILPYTNGFAQFGNELGKFTEAGLPNITGVSSGNQDQSGALSGAFYLLNAHLKNSGGDWYASQEGFDASRCSPIYGKSDTVQPNSVTGYLYFYIGEVEQDANIIATSGLAESVSRKADNDLGNVPSSKGILVESYHNDSSWYRVYSDGWCEQGGELGWTSSNWASNTKVLIKPFRDTTYNLIVLGNWSNSESSSCSISAKTTIDFTVRYAINIAVQKGVWYACGYIR